jgi:hypothetical protein
VVDRLKAFGSDSSRRPSLLRIQKAWEGIFKKTPVFALRQVGYIFDLHLDGDDPADDLPLKAVADLDAEAREFNTIGTVYSRIPAPGNQPSFESE